MYILLLNLKIKWTHNFVYDLSLYCFMNKSKYLRKFYSIGVCSKIAWNSKAVQNLCRVSKKSFWAKCLSVCWENHHWFVAKHYGYGLLSAMCDEWRGKDKSDDTRRKHCQVKMSKFELMYSCLIDLAVRTICMWAGYNLVYEWGWLNVR